MHWKQTLAIAILIPFSALSVYALIEKGYIGLLQYHMADPAGWQVFTDLVIALVLVSLWMISDARRTARNVWPYLVATLFLGSFGPLAYLLFSSSPNTVPTAQG